MRSLTESGAPGRALILELAAGLERVAAELDWERAEAVAATLDAARRVLLFGAGRSRAVALAIGQRLGHVGLDVALVGEAGNRSFGAADALVLISGTGRTASVLTAAEQARAAAERGHVVVLTYTDPSPVGELADLVLRVPARSREVGHGGIAPFTAPFDFAALAVGEVLAREIMERRGLDDADIERSRPNVE